MRATPPPSFHCQHMHCGLDPSGLVSRLLCEWALDVNSHRAIVRSVSTEGLQGSLHIDGNVPYLALAAVLTPALRGTPHAPKRQTGCDQALLSRVQARELRRARRVVRTWA